ncbi:PAS domain-containing protein [Mycobacteroides abscessus]|uniref:PAS domain-containing protein n=1 Tax=Mycobacteroides abscessus TaxID=36809 RepID=UPI0021049B66|nr:PAS domain-containing protein [Mycobacteroides abscessus]
MSQDWLLLETMADEPSVLAIGSTPKNMVPIETFLRRSPNLSILRDAVAHAKHTGKRLVEEIRSKDRVILVEPVAMDSGDVHGVHMWIGPRREVPPRRPMPGAWLWNLTTGVVIGTKESLDNGGANPENRQPGRTFAEDFEHVESNPEETAAIAKVIESKPGDTFCSTWNGRDYLGNPTRVHFAVRILAERNVDGQPETIARAINLRVQPTKSVIEQPQQIILAQQILAGLAEPGTYRALVDLRTLNLIKWVDEPMPELDWKYSSDRSSRMHPDDLPVAKAMSDGLAISRTEGILRFRTCVGTWMPIHVTAHLVLLNQYTTAALVILRES